MSEATVAPVLGPVFVTGANGWLGRRMVAALCGQNPDGAQAGATASEVRALVMPGEPTRPLLDLGASVVSGDIRDSAAVSAFLEPAKGGTVIHLAGVIHPPSKRVREFFEVNVSAVRQLAEVATARGVRRIVAMSSNSPFGANDRPGQCFDEQSPYRPYMSYGRSKKAMEEVLIERISETGAPEIVIVRAPWFYGPGQPPRQTRFLSMIRAGRFPIVGAGENWRSMANVDDLSRGVLLAASTSAAAGRVYWIADRRPYSMNEIISTVRAVLSDDFGIKVSQRQPRIPSAVSDIARVADAVLQQFGFYQQEIHVLSEMNLNIACSIERAQNELGYEPRIELREGMRRSVQWCLDHKITL